MPDVKQKVVSEDKTAIAPDGTTVRAQTRTLASKGNPKATIMNVVWYLYGLVAILLVIRFVLKLAGANSANGFVSFIYSVTGFLSAPFDTIFNTSTTTHGSVTSVFEPSILVAIIVYALIAWGIVKLLSLNEAQSTT